MRRSFADPGFEAHAMFLLATVRLSSRARRALCAELDRLTDLPETRRCIALTALAFASVHAIELQFVRLGRQWVRDAVSGRRRLIIPADDLPDRDFMRWERRHFAKALLATIDSSVIYPPNSHDVWGRDETLIISRNDKTDRIAVAPERDGRESPVEVAAWVESVAEAATAPQERALIDAFLKRGCGSLAEVERLFRWSRGHASVVASRLQEKHRCRNAA